MNVELLKTILKIAAQDSRDVTKRPVLLNEIVNEVDISKSLVKSKLRDLVNEGCLKYEAIGSHTVMLTSAGMRMANGSHDSAQTIQSHVPAAKKKLFS